MSLRLPSHRHQSCSTVPGRKYHPSCRAKHFRPSDRQKNHVRIEDPSRDLCDAKPTPARRDSATAAIEGGICSAFCVYRHRRTTTTSFRFPHTPGIPTRCYLAEFGASTEAARHIDTGFKRRPRRLQDRSDPSTWSCDSLRRGAANQPRFGTGDQSEGSSTISSARHRYAAHTSRRAKRDATRSRSTRTRSASWRREHSEAGPGKSLYESGLSAVRSQRQRQSAHAERCCSCPA